MKKIITILFASALTLAVNAQSEWTRPTNASSEQKVQKRGLFDKSKAPVDPKYLEGAVPEVDGKICWTKEIQAPGKSAQEVYDKVLDYMQKFVKGEEQTELSQVAVVNKAERQIGVRLNEILTFQRSALSLDQTKFNYSLMIYCKDGSCEVRMTNLSYSYEEGRETAAKFPAEEMISDSSALNKKKTGFTKGGSKKFRTKTIDRKDEVFSLIQNVLK